MGNRTVTSGNRVTRKIGGNVNLMKNIDVSQLTECQARALKLMLSGENVFLTGEAGTGKSEVVKIFIEMSQQRGDQILVTAPTGTAADNLHGETIHRCFGANIGIQKMTCISPPGM